MTVGLKHIFRSLLVALALTAASCDSVDNPEEPSKKEDNVKPKPGSTVYGLVSCQGKGLPNVVISDGYEVTTTDNNGVYQLASGKENGYVFISIPSGYEVLSDGVIPMFSSSLIKDAATAERVDFTLTEASQDNYSLLILGDMHLANRTFCKDISQFREFAKDAGAYMKSRDRKFYAITLGDMSWDYFWTTNNYDLKSYLAELKADFRDIQVFHTMGNHDNDSGFAGDFAGSSTYRRIIGPNYYSFNIGGIHYVVLDDIIYFNSPEGSRNFKNSVSDEQLEWLKKDLTYVSRQTPLVITMHAPLYRNDGSSALTNLGSFIKLFDGFERVQMVTGHMHAVYNVDMLSRSIHIYENNSGAVCGAWWMTALNYPGIHICSDGSPGGYRVMDIDGKQISWMYKATGHGEDYQFRTYDRNEIELSADKWVPKASAEDKKAFLETATGYTTASKANQVLINIWDYDPSWTVTVSENGRNLPVKKLNDVKDPLYLVTYEAYEYNHSYSISYPSSNTDHIFSVTASGPDTDLDITVTDRFGRVYRERMERPREFSTDEY